MRKREWICALLLAVRGKLESIKAIKVIPLKLFYYQTFYETWRNEHSWYEHYKNAIKNGVTVLVYASAGS